MQLILISGITIAIGAVAFALQNNAPVVVTLALWTFEGSLALVLLVSLGIGALIAGLLSSPAVIRRQWTMGRLRNRVADLERQLAEQQERARARDREIQLTRQSPFGESPDPVAEKPYVGLRAFRSGSDSDRASSPGLEPPRDEEKR